MGSAQPTLANFGSATFTDMTYDADANVAVNLSPINMVDESGNADRHGWADDEIGSVLLLHGHLRADPRGILARRI